MQKSQGHIMFEDAKVGSSSMTWEFYRFNESIYRANAIAPVMPDGYRCGRWFSPYTSTYLEALVEEALA